MVKALESAAGFAIYQVAAQYRRKLHERLTMPTSSRDTMRAKLSGGYADVYTHYRDMYINPAVIKDRAESSDGKIITGSVFKSSFGKWVNHSAAAFTRIMNEKEYAQRFPGAILETGVPTPPIHPTASVAR